MLAVELEHAAGHPRDADLPVGAPDAGVEVLHDPVPLQPADQVAPLQRVHPHAQIQGRTAKHPVAPVPEHLLVGIVDVDVYAVVDAGDGNGLRAHAEHRRELRFGLAHCGLDALALADVEDAPAHQPALTRAQPHQAHLASDVPAVGVPVHPFEHRRLAGHRGCDVGRRGLGRAAAVELQRGRQLQRAKGKQGGARQTEQPGGVLVDVHEVSAVRIEHHDGLGGVLDQRAIAFFALPLRGLRRHAVGDVGKRHHHRMRAGVAGLKQRLGVDGDPAQPVAPAPHTHQHVAAGLTGLERARGRVIGGRERRAIGVDRLPRRIAQLAAHQLVVAQPQDALGAFVRGQALPVGRDQHHTLGQPRDERPVALLALGERQLRELLVGDVRGQAGQAQRLAGFAAAEPASRLQPAHLAVLPHHAVLGEEVLAAALDAIVHHRPNTLAVVRVDHPHHGVGGAVELLQGQPEQRRRTLRPAHLAAGKLPLPHAHARRIQGDAQLILARPQRVLGALALGNLLLQRAVGRLQRGGAVLDPLLQHLGQRLQVVLGPPPLAHLGFQAAVDLRQLRLARHAQCGRQHSQQVSPGCHRDGGHAQVDHARQPGAAACQPHTIEQMTGARRQDEQGKQQEDTAVAQVASPPVQVQQQHRDRQARQHQRQVGRGVQPRARHAFGIGRRDRGQGAEGGFQGRSLEQLFWGVAPV